MQKSNHPAPKKNYKKPNSIECKKAKLTFKKFNIQRPSIDSVLKKLVYNFKLSQGAVAVVTKELKPKTAKIDSNSMLDLGSQIRGKILEGFSTDLIRSPDVVPFSGKHQAQNTYASGFVFCRIFISFY